MDISRNEVESIISYLQQVAALPASFDAGSVFDTDSLAEALISHNNDAHFEVFPEDWGADDDLDKEYIYLLRQLENHSDGAMVLSDFESSTDGEHVQIAFKANGAPQEWEFDQTSDRFSGEFLEHFLDLQKILPDKRYLYLEGRDCPAFLLLPKAVANLLLQYEISGYIESASEYLSYEDVLDEINFAKTHRVKELNLTEKNIERLPPQIGSLTDLEVLRLAENRLQEVAEQVCELKNLKVLELHGNDLTDLPASLERLQKLEELTLGGNRLTVLPPVIFKLVSLKRLAFPVNKIKSIPGDIKNLVNLEKILCSQNKFVGFPVELCSVPSLKELDICWNNLKAVPDEIGSLVNLTDLYLMDCKLKSMSAEVGKLKNLRRLVLSYNQLESLPATLADLPNCRRIDLEHNPLFSHADYNQGTKHLKAYLKDLSEN